MKGKNKSHCEYCCTCHEFPGKHPIHFPDTFEMAERLHQKSLKMTSQRQAVLKVLQQKHYPLTMKEIHSKLDSEGDLATVYRTIHVLEESGMVRRCDFGDRIARFELTCSCGSLHHHHLICTQCSSVQKVEVNLPDEILQSIAKSTGFTNVNAHLEFFGVCPQCRKKLHPKQ